MFFLIFANISEGKSINPEKDWLVKLQELEEKQRLNPRNLNGYIEELEVLLEQYGQKYTDSDSIYNQIANRLGDWYCKNGDYDRGIFLLKKTLSNCKISKNPKVDASFAAVLYFNLGYFYEKLDSLENFHIYMDSCIVTARNYPKRLENGINAFEKISIHYMERGDHFRSLQHIDKGLLFAEEVGSNAHTSLLYLQKAQVLLQENRIQEANTTIETALELLSKSSNKERYLRIAYLVMASLSEKRENFDEAISYYQKTHDLNYKLGYFLDSYKAMNNMGVVYALDVKDPEASLRCFQQCIELLDLLGEKTKLPTVYNNIGYVYQDQGNIEEALNSFQSGLMVLPLGVSDLDWSENPSRKALRGAAYDRILYTLIDNKAETLLKLHKQRKDPAILPVALETFKLADLTINLMRWNQQHDESKLFWRKKSRGMYELAIETSYLLQDIESALYFFEKSRAVLLNDKLSELGAHQFLSEEDATKEQEFKSKMVSLQRKLSGTPQTSPIYKELANERFQVQEAYEAFIRSLEAKYPNYYQYKYDTTVVSLDKLTKEVLEPDQAYLGYFVGKEHLYALTVDQDTAALHKFPLGDFHSSARELLSLSSSQGKLNQQYSRYIELSNDLYQSFFQPLGLTNRRILISPDDYLIPFEMLIKDPEDFYSFLLKDHAFSYTYSVGFLLKNGNKVRNQTATLLGMAPVDFQSHLQQTSLLGSGQSLDRLKEHFSSYSLFTGQQATKEKFLSQLSQNDIVHLYSHAVADDTDTEPTLYFADSMMFVSELQGLGNLPTQLIILSACNTAIGKNVPGEGVFSLARGFASAGIPSSITSLWPIDNHSTYSLSEIFYEILSQGKPTDLALQEAKLRFLNENPGNYQLPYFWAAEVLVGKSFTFNMRTNYVFYIQILVLLLIVGTIGWGIYRRYFQDSDSLTP
ncbi:CHAT domain-containing protein [Cyclobacterium plantarum]|uniref:CHAT domain-containing protein n=1 Tax=Cyclobacterium plantarum TaxID=2716263 RepID=A0ABX0H9L2_9BACT|nr:CHAT domain-containing tetratricopeptide repeat protein [Cyclobacterium plantarum]NHE58468.1 CHAT domain-containing protein [Cyclobacterium plantarum]